MMAEKRDCEGTTEDEGDDIKRKRLDTNAFAGTRSDISDDTRSDISDDTRSDISDDTSNDISDDTRSDISDDTRSDISDDTSNDISDNTSSEYDKDPLSYLTRNQRAVLYTLFLCSEDTYLVYQDDDDGTLGDIDVKKTLEELEDMGLMKNITEVFGSGGRTVYNVTDEKLDEITQSYIKKCLLSDIDRDFFLDVADDFPLYDWYTTQNRIINRDVLNPQDSRSITLMRLIMEGRMDVVKYIIGITDDKLVPAGILAEFEEFVQFWKKRCQQRNIHPSDWFNGVSDREKESYFSAYTLLSDYEEEFLKLVLNKSKWSILILILMSEKYSILYEEKLLEEKVDKIQHTFLTMNCSDDGVSNYTFLIQDLIHNDKLLTMNRENKTLEFISEDIRHQVMGYFVLNCLQSDEDYNNYIQLSSFDSLFDYVRTMGYEMGEPEKCMFIPKRMEKTLTRRIGIDILRHATVEDDEMKDIVCKTLNIPREILYWKYDARCRYIECAKKGTQTIHRARAMIVGCAGAGKTTLLKRLQKRSLDELQQVQSTIGLEVHEDIFEILEDKYFLTAVTEDSEKEGKALLSVMDFGGQCAYYACHQVYLSRRAFYLLVIDMSKSFGEKVDPALCKQEGTMFSDWTYGDYLLFWLKSVHTYCDSNAPVIIVGTHLDSVKGKNSDTFYNTILDQLHFNKHLRTHLDRTRCFVLGFQTDGVCCNDSLSELEKCIVAIAKEDKWKESIPTDWALCEVVVRENRRQESRMLSHDDLLRKCFGENKEKYAQIRDILKFFHDIGIILYYHDNNLSGTVIIDIQWFVDSFKNVITDPNHVRDIAENSIDWENFNKSGFILDKLLTGIWSSKHFKMDLWDRNHEKTNLLQYMQRLGLMAVGNYAHYIPCMNKHAFGITEERYFLSLQRKTSVLVYRFQFLPWFFYYRLIVACLTRTNGEWTVLKDNGLCLYKNVACFAYKEHIVALAVNNSSIQLQICQPTNILVLKEVALNVRDTVERLLKELLGNFHKKIDMYTVGYQCRHQEVFREHDDCFVEEKAIYKKGNIRCPRHGMVNHHILNESALLVYWKLDVIAEISDFDDLMDQDECSRLSEPELKKMNFKSFEKLTKIGRDALQLYFDRIFPPVDLVTTLTTNKDNLQRGQYKLNQDQCTLLFPADKSIPTSSTFDVTIMYKLLRNYGPNLLPPTNGWGKKPEIGQRLPTDDLERIRIYRNEVEHKTQTTNVMEKDDFDLKWRDLCQAILRLSNGSLKQDIMSLRRQR